MILWEFLQPMNFTNATWYDIGVAELSQLDSAQVERLKEAYYDISSELVKFTLEFGYADIYARNNLAKTHRQVATIAALTALEMRCAAAIEISYQCRVKYWADC